MNKGVYVHVPFCVRKCPYCDFYSAPADGETRRAYAAAAARALENAPWEFTADTLYVGGGTPTLLEAEDLLRIRRAAERRFGLSGAECTLEANPGTVSPEALRRLAEGGFDRISFGVQALSDGLLRSLGRIHSVREALGALKDAARAGFRHISADLMLAVPGQTPEEIRRSVKILAETPADHLSCYLLQIEEGTPFFGAVSPPEEDFAAQCYEAAADAAEEAGFLQYEISNFARSPEARSRHNLHYWRDEEYLGVGPAAHSFMEGKRFFFPRDAAAFLGAEDPWRLTIPDGAGGDGDERVLLGLRLTEGIDPFLLGPAAGEELRRRAAPFVAAGLMRDAGGRLSLTRRGFLVSNSVIAALIG